MLNLNITGIFWVGVLVSAFYAWSNTSNGKNGFKWENYWIDLGFRVIGMAIFCVILHFISVYW